MAIHQLHELHARRAKRNIMLGGAMGIFAILVFFITTVKFSEVLERFAAERDGAAVEAAE